MSVLLFRAGECTFTPTGSSTTASGRKVCGAAGERCTTRTAPSTRGSGWRISPTGRACCGSVSADHPHPAPSKRFGVVLLSGGLPHPDFWMLHCSLAAGLRPLRVIPPLLVWRGRRHRLSKGRHCAARAHKPTRMKAYFCCDLHLNDWDGSG